MAWFIKTESFCLPRESVTPHLRAHLAWVRELRNRGELVSSGYRVDAAGQPGGGGLMILQAEDHAAAEALVSQDPLILSGCVTWQLQGWIPSVGDLRVV
ncbi:MAG: YciI family protein [Cyanobium sp. CZS 25K]|nr:YciI family protein [Cyanobium sp. CZS25K]